MDRLRQTKFCASAGKGKGGVGLPKIACGQRNELSSQREERRGRGMPTKSPPAAKSLKEEASSLGEKGRGATYFNLSASVTAKVPSTKKKRSNLLPNFVRKREREKKFESQKPFLPCHVIPLAWKKTEERDSLPSPLPSLSVDDREVGKFVTQNHHPHHHSGGWLRLSA